MVAKSESQSALIALNRFGFGARGGDANDLQAAAADPRGFVKADLTYPDRALLAAHDLPDTSTLLGELYELNAERKAARQQRAAEAPPMDMTAASPPSETEPPQSERQKTKPRPGPLNVVQRSYRDEALARFRSACRAEVGFAERLVGFWSNHFAVAVDKDPLVRISAGAFEREAIRPHCLGRFADMLRAVEQHPAMLNYLDNQLSFGPDSRAGRNRKRGLNENLAREIMELHTLGVDGGYTQADVTSFARILTGWTIAGPQGRLGPPAAFVFFPNAHEPGPQTLLGKIYPDDGLRQGEAALNDLAHHPSTATFIATKLVRHFVGEDAPPALVARLARIFRKTDGDLRAVSLALVDSDEAWRAPLAKLRSPYEFMIASMRMLGHEPDNPQPILGGLNLLGMPLWNPPGPNGFPDSNAAWMSPEGMKLRLDIAARIGAQQQNGLLDPNDVLQDVIGQFASQQTREAVARAASKDEAFALLIMSPEFQRR